MSDLRRVDAVVADVGGTNARFAWCSTRAEVKLNDVRSYACADFDGMAEAFEAYCAELSISTDRLSAALACPCEHDRIALTNNHWAFGRAELLQRLQLRELRTINDFTAQALAVPLLPEGQKHVLHAGQSVRAPILVVGPGTGLGVGALVPAADDWVPVVTEGGHVTASAVDPRDAAVLEQLCKRFGHVSAERLISGPGLVNGYLAEAAVRGELAEDLDAAQITQRALEGDALCKAVLDRFCRVFGGVVGDAAMSLGARGGIAIAGGIVPRILDFIQDSEFLSRLHHKGRFSGYMRNIQVTVMVSGDPGLLGSAAALNNAHLQDMGYVSAAV
ncbi:MAG: glucokinase [Granulosicoccaceae bacterium]